MSAQRRFVRRLPSTGGDVGRVPSHGGAPTRRKSIAQDKEHGGRAQTPALSHESQNTSRPEGAKEGYALSIGWRWVTLGDVAESMKNGIYKPASSYAEDGLACLRMYNIGDGK